MTTLSVSKGDVELAITKFPDRKYHSLCVRKGSRIFVIGTCKDPDMWNSAINELFK